MTTRTVDAAFRLAMPAASAAAQRACLGDIDTNVQNGQMDLPSLDDLVDLAAQLRGADLRGYSEAKTGDLLRRFLTHYQPQAVTYRENCIWFRAVKCSNEGFPSLHRCIHLPGGSPNLGRANLRHRPVFYAGWNVMTAFDEVHAAPGEFIQLIGANVQPGKEAHCLNVGDIQRRYSSGRSLFDDPGGVSRIASEQQHDLQQYLLSLYLDSVMAELFRKQSDNPHDYLLTATFADFVHGGNLSVLYPSVRTLHALNIAVPGPVFDDTFQVLLAEVHRVDKYFGHGIYETTRTKQSTKFAEDGTIDWSDWSGLNCTVGKHGAREPVPGTIGWRVNRTSFGCCLVCGLA